MRPTDSRLTDKSWRDLFLTGLRRYAADDENPHHLTGSLDQWFDDLQTVGTSQEEQARGDIFKVAYRAMMLQQLERSLREMERVEDKCESPIEIAMLYALTIVARESADSVYYLVDDWECGERKDGGEVIGIQPQAQLGEHRVDFLLSVDIWGPDFENKQKIPEELQAKYGGLKETAGTKHIRKQMIVECDGHEFHERTKEQASRDRQRDRTLQSLGLPVFRFTGSDIWSDVFRCANEAISTLSKSAWEVL